MSRPIPLQEKAEPALAPIAPKSKGEKLFDRVVYGGLAGVGTFIITIPVAFLLQYKKPAYYTDFVHWIERQLGHVFSTSVSRETAEEVVRTTALMQGGNLMLIPVGLAERHKVSIVSGLNTMLGDPTPKEAIEQAPKQTWVSLIESRAVAWLGVFGAFAFTQKFFGNTLRTFETEAGNLLCEVTGKPTTRMQEVVIDGVKTMAPAESKTFIFGKLGAVDIFATAAAATLLYVGGHFFARKQEEKKADKKNAKSSRTEVVSRSDDNEKPSKSVILGEAISSYEGTLSKEQTSLGR